MTNIGAQPTWVDAAASCTLPTADTPLRLTEFDQLFADHTLAVSRDSQTQASFVLRREPAVAAAAAHLATRETQCCAFFEFSLAMTDAQLTMSVAVPDPQRAPVLDALVQRATTLQPGAS